MPRPLQNRRFESEGRYACKSGHAIQVHKLCAARRAISVMAPVGVVQDGQRRPRPGDSAAESGGKHAIVAVQLEEWHGERMPS